MTLLAACRRKGGQSRSHIYSLYLAMRDPRVPWYVRVLTLLVVAYVISPVDIIPDFIPVLGLLDEIILVPIALALIVRLIPAEVLREYQAKQREIKNPGLKIVGAIIVALVWIVLIFAGYLLWQKMQ